MTDDYTPTTAAVRERYSMQEPVQDLLRAEFDRWLAAHDREVAAKALEDARVRPEFVEYLPNDGTYEYTSTSDCDGSNVKYLRRKPQYVGGHHPWENTTAEQFRTAKFREDS